MALLFTIAAKTLTEFAQATMFVVKEVVISLITKATVFFVVEATKSFATEVTIKRGRFIIEGLWSLVRVRVYRSLRGFIMILRSPRVESM